MMSSEDDTECFGLYGDKLLKKAKRTRQRVDAGEPRNSYSSIPNFSSRPSFMSGGLYGAIFNPNQQQSQQQQQHFSGLFNSANQQQQCNNFAPAKMLNELLGRQMKAADAATSAENNCLNMIGSAMDTSSVNNSSDPQGLMVNGTSNNYESATMLRRSETSENEQSSPQSTNNLVDNAHMLRDILQGRKKELLALEQELRAVSGGGNSENTREFSVSPTNNNNNEIKNISSTENNSGSDSDCAVVGGVNISAAGSGPPSPTNHHSNVNNTSELPEITSDRDEMNSEEEVDEEDVNSDAESHGKQPAQPQSQQQSEIIMDNDNSDSFHSDSSRGSNNSLVNIKEEDMIMDDEDEDINSQNPNNASQHSNKGDNKSQQSVPTESLEIKRARVENIVSSMRSSPSLPVQVNGCKKRKLYHPQQHESARYGAGIMMEDEEEDAPALKQKRVEKDALKTQLRTMQEQLAEMQQKYVQLCNRMEMESDCQDENTGDMTMELASASAIAAAAAAAAQAEELLEKSAGLPSTVGNNNNSNNNSSNNNTKDVVMLSSTPNSTSSIINNPSSTPITGNITPNILPSIHNNNSNNSMHKQQQILPPNNNNSKLHQHAVANIHPTTMQQHQQQQAMQAAVAAQQQQQQHAGITLNGAGVPNLLHQHAVVAQHHALHPNSHTPLQNPAAAAAAAAAMYLGVGHKMFLEQEAQRLKEAVGGDHPHHPQLPPHHHHPGGQGPPSGGPIPPPQPHHHPCGPPPHHHHHPSSHQLAVAAAQAAKNAEFSERFPFFRNAQSGPITGSDLEGLAEVLKSEISASLTILIDSILNRFLQQRRFLGKQSDAAAEQLNKDLLLASQLLDRKSPRTKVIDRGPNNNSNNANNNGGGGSNIGGGINNNNSSNPGTSNSGNGQGCGSTGPRVSGTAFPINLANTSTNNSSNNSVQNSSSVTPNHMDNNSSNNNNLPPHLRPPISIASTSMFQHPKPPSAMSNNSNNTSSSVATASMPAVINGAPNGPASSALYSMGSLAGSNPFCHINEQQHQQQREREREQREREQHQREREQRDSQRDTPRDRELPEQNEALSLVVTTKKKRHKVTDTRITPRTVSRILSQDNTGGPPPSGTPNSTGAITPGPGGVVGNMMDPKYGSMVPSTSANTAVVNTSVKAEQQQQQRAGMPGNVNECTSPRPYHPPPPPMLPVSLPTSVAIPNPGLHESQVFSPYSPFYGQHQSSSPPDRRDAESPISHPPTLLHPALLAAHGTPDYGHMRSAAGGPNGGGPVDNGDRGMDCHSADSPYDGMQPALSFSNSRWFPCSARLTSPVRDSGKKSIRDYLSLLKQESMGSLNEPYSSTLTPMHLRKAKLMFFWVRYPSSAVLKMYFPDIKFNKNNTAQLVKWFSNFREFYYIQMEKYARQAITEGMKNADDLQVTGDSEIYRVLNLHYNRNNHIEVPSNFRYVVEQTLREFFKAIQGGKDTEQSWKKSIYKVISRLDDPVPEYFKSPNFLEQLE